MVNKKLIIRKELLLQRNSLSNIYKSNYQIKISKVILEVLKEKKCKSLHIYLAINNEVCTNSIIKSCFYKGIEVFVPIVISETELMHVWLKKKEFANSLFEKGAFNTLQPTNATPYQGSFDVIIVPGVAFDKQGYRLGYGKGYYDRFLKDHANSFKIGLAYPFQVLDHIPHESHDIKVDFICYLDNFISD